MEKLSAESVGDLDKHLRYTAASSGLLLTTIGDYERKHPAGAIVPLPTMRTYYAALAEQARTLSCRAQAVVDTLDEHFGRQS